MEAVSPVKKKGGRPKGSPAMGGRPKGSPAVGGRPKGSPAVGGRPKGSAQMGGRPKGSPQVGGRPKGSLPVGGIKKSASGVPRAAPRRLAPAPTPGASRHQPQMRAPSVSSGPATPPRLLYAGPPKTFDDAHLAKTGSPYNPFRRT